MQSERRTVIQELASNIKPPNLRINLLIKHVLVIAWGRRSSGLIPQDLQVVLSLDLGTEPTQPLQEKLTPFLPCPEVCG